jgi:dihydrofolate reductase
VDLFEAGLVDECRLMIFPTALGSGKQLFDGLSAPVALELTESRRAGECLILIYGPKA